MSTATRCFRTCAILSRATYNARDDLMALADYVATKREYVDDEKARAARILHGLIRNERFG